MRDLGLNYWEAMRGVQSAIKYEMNQEKMQGRSTDDHIKHLRVGIDARAADAQGLAALLMKKGVFTLEEYAEHMRLAANEELARYTEHCRKEYGLPPGVDFR